LTIENLLTMSLGQETVTAPNPYEDADWAERIFAQPITAAPGSTFQYNSAAPELLAVILQKATGKTMLEYAQEKLFGPLGITDVTWLADPQGINFGNSWLMLKPSDMARIGYLYINGGLWNGQQVVPKAWVEQSTQKHMDTRGKMNRAEDDGYGYLWWMNGFGGYSAHGMGGQFIFVVPQSNLVVVFTGGFADPQFPLPYDFMKETILPAMKSDRPLARNDRALQALNEAVEKAANLSPTHPTTALPEMARFVSGKRFVLGPNSLNADSITLYFENEAEYRVVITAPYNGQEIKLEYTGGLDGRYRVNKGMEDPRVPILSGYTAAWQDDRVFVQYSTPVDNVSKYIYQFTFDKAGTVFIQVNLDLSGKIKYIQTVTGIIED